MFALGDRANEMRNLVLQLLQIEREETVSTAIATHIEPDQISETELETVVQTVHGLPVGSPLRDFLQTVIDAGQRGAGITALAQDGELTPNQAAKALGMSRPHLLKFIRNGALNVHYVGSHQRISYADFMDFKQRHDDASKDVATALAADHAPARQITLTDEEMAELDAL